MKRLLPLAATLALLVAPLPALAQAAAVVPGQEFLTQWDLDGNGAVTLAEAREHRSDIFTMFDSDDNGSFSVEELKGIDSFKLAQLDAGMGPGHQRPDGVQPGGQGMGQGFGKGQPRGMGGGGMGGGQGQGQGMGFFAAAQDGMMAFDRNRDGAVSKIEFVAGTDGWFALRDANGDGTLTLADFGPRR